MTFKFDNTYEQLPPHFYSRQNAASFPNVELLALNNELLHEFGAEEFKNLSETELARLFSGQDTFEYSSPLAQVYAGHQFGHFNPQLGDGRALLLGEILTTDNKRFDLQLKGVGQTPYSRSGDGLSPIGPVLREYIVSESMHALGVPTTRSLAAVATGQKVYRESALPGAILTRVAESHIRIGTFQYFLGQGDHASLKRLADYTIDRHYPSCLESENQYLDLFCQVSKKLNETIVQWMSLGFIHGVMNTDNMAVSGETLDYGPCAFLDEFQAAKFFSFVDRGGRYRYENQPGILQWNLARFAECLVPLVDENQETSISLLTNELEKSQDSIREEVTKKMAQKLGVLSPVPEDKSLVSLWLEHLESSKLDFTNAHRHLINILEGHDELSELDKGAGFASFYQSWSQRVSSAPKQELSESLTQMRSLNPQFVPRNHLVQKAIEEAEKGEELVTFQQLCEVLKDPFHVTSEYEDFLKPPKPDEMVEATFCGT